MWFDYIVAAAIAKATTYNHVEMPVAPLRSAGRGFDTKSISAGVMVH